MQVSTLDILIDKAHFEPKVARAVAEAIENEINGNQIVTVPVLDARFTEFKSAMDARFTELTGAMDSRFGTVDSRFGTVNSQFGTVNSRFNDLEVKMESQKAELVRWVFTAMLAQTATILGFTYALQHLR